MAYLDPAASAALAHADDLMIHGCQEEEAMSRAQQAKQELQQLIDADPRRWSYGAAHLVYPEDWF